eukprot:g2819.t1
MSIVGAAFLAVVWFSFSLVVPEVGHRLVPQIPPSRSFPGPQTQRTTSAFLEQEVEEAVYQEEFADAKRGDPVNTTFQDCGLVAPPAGRGGTPLFQDLVDAARYADTGTGAEIFYTPQGLPFDTNWALTQLHGTDGWLGGLWSWWRRKAEARFEIYQRETQNLARTLHNHKHCDLVKSALAKEKGKPGVKTGRGKKIAYLVLSDEAGAFHQEGVWARYFETCPHDVANLYVHASNSTSENLERAATREEKEKVESWKKRLQAGGGEAKFVPKVHTAWGELAVAQWWLVINALQNAENEQFVFLSRDAVPLKDCRTVSDILLQEPPRSTNPVNKGERSDMVGKKQGRQQHAVSRSNICFVHQSSTWAPLPKHHQWGTLNREDATRFGKFVVRGLNLWMAKSLKADYYGEHTQPMCDYYYPDEFVLVSSIIAARAPGNAAGAFGDSSAPARRAGAHAIAKAEMQFGGSRCPMFMLWQDAFAEETGLPEPRDTRNGGPRDFHWNMATAPCTTCGASGRGAYWARPNEALMRALVQYSGFLFARKMGKTKQKPLPGTSSGGELRPEPTPAALVFDLNKEAWEGAEVSLPQLWAEEPEFSTEVEVYGEFAYGPKLIPDHVFAEKGDGMQKALASAMWKGTKEMEQKRDPRGSGGMEAATKQAVRAQALDSDGGAKVDSQSSPSADADEPLHEPLHHDSRVGLEGEPILPEEGAMKPHTEVLLKRVLAAAQYPDPADYQLVFSVRRNDAAGRERHRRDLAAQAAQWATDVLEALETAPKDDDDTRTLLKYLHEDLLSHRSHEDLRLLLQQRFMNSYHFFVGDAGCTLPRSGEARFAHLYDAESCRTIADGKTMKALPPADRVLLKKLEKEAQRAEELLTEQLRAEAESGDVVVLPNLCNRKICPWCWWCPQF